MPQTGAIPTSTPQDLGSKTSIELEPNNETTIILYCTSIPAFIEESMVSTVATLGGV
ncbi:hypothetical protein [Myroides sp. DW712]|uniref:hypothetical protein n=1 Tax=Myroides sp. DW712 TaxID=3389800 RepID=UPI00397B0EF1